MMLPAPAPSILAKLILCLLATLPLQSGAQMASPPAGAKVLALPVLTQPVILRVVVAENPRFEELTPASVAAVLAHAQQAVKLNFNLDIEFESKPRKPVSTQVGGQQFSLF